MEIGIHNLNELRITNYELRIIKLLADIEQQQMCSINNIS